MADLMTLQDLEFALEATGGVKVRLVRKTGDFNEVFVTCGHKEQIQAERMGENGLVLADPLTLLVPTAALPDLDIDETLDVFDEDGVSFTTYTVVGAIPDDRDGALTRWEIGEV